MLLILSMEYANKRVPFKVVKKKFHHERYNKALFDPKHEDKVTSILSDLTSIVSIHWR